jgi:hypothetical protein
MNEDKQLKIGEEIFDLIRSYIPLEDHILGNPTLYRNLALEIEPIFCKRCGKIDEAECPPCEHGENIIDLDNPPDPPYMP